jgi:hypothetical protein
MDLVWPVMMDAVDGFGPDHWYAYLELGAKARRRLATALRDKSVDLLQDSSAGAQALLLADLAAWLEARPDEKQVVTFIGI